VQDFPRDSDSDRAQSANLSPPPPNAPAPASDEAKDYDEPITAPSTPGPTTAGDLEPGPDEFWPRRGIKLSRRTALAVHWTLEEALRVPFDFTPDLIEEAGQMADLSGPTRYEGTGELPAPPAIGQQSEPRAMTPRQVMARRKERERNEEQKREARIRAQEEEDRAEGERRRLSAQRRAEAAGVGGGEGVGRAGSQRRSTAAAAARDSRGEEAAAVESQRRRERRESRERTGQAQPRPQELNYYTSAPPISNLPQPTARMRSSSDKQASSRPAQQSSQAARATSGTYGASPTKDPPASDRAQARTTTASYAQQGRQPPTSTTIPPLSTSTSAPPPLRPTNASSFPHAFERWETLSSHWEGLTGYWIKRLQENSGELKPIDQQLARQVTDLGAAGANLFHAVVELQRLRASSERKFQRWFFESRGENERNREEIARLREGLAAERSLRREEREGNGGGGGDGGGGDGGGGDGGGGGASTRNTRGLGQGQGHGQGQRGLDQSSQPGPDPRLLEAAAAAAAATAQRQAQVAAQAEIERVRLAAAEETERVRRQADQMVKEMRRELQISRDEARRGWEEIGRMEQNERDRVFSLKRGEPTLVGKIQVVPTPGSGSRAGGGQGAGVGSVGPMGSRQTTRDEGLGSHPVDERRDRGGDGYDEEEREVGAGAGPSVEGYGDATRANADYEQARSETDTDPFTESGRDLAGSVIGRIPGLNVTPTTYPTSQAAMSANTRTAGSGTLAGELRPATATGPSSSVPFAPQPPTNPSASMSPPQSFPFPARDSSLTSAQPADRRMFTAAQPQSQPQSGTLPPVASTDRTTFYQQSPASTALHSPGPHPAVTQAQPHSATILQAEDTRSYGTLSDEDVVEEEYALDQHGNIQRDAAGRPIMYSPQRRQVAGEEYAVRRPGGVGAAGGGGGGRDGQQAQTQRHPTSNGNTPTHPSTAVGAQPQPDYTGDSYGVGAGYGASEWSSVLARHHHPTRLSDVLEEDERSRTSPSRASERSRGGRL